MKRTLILAFMSVLTVLAVSCKPNTPVNPEPTPSPTPGPDPGPDPKPEIVHLTRFTDVDGNILEALVFDVNKGVSTIYLTVEANYFWDLDKDADTWPTWITKPGRTSGVLDEEDGLYRLSFALNLNDAEAGDIDKNGVITFTDLDDETFTKELEVKYIAKTIPEHPFSINCDLGTEIHINPANNAFRDKDGNDIAGKYWLDFTVNSEDDLENFKIVLWEARAYKEAWQSSANLNYNYFNTYAPDPEHPEKQEPQPTLMRLNGASLTDPENPKAFSLFITSGAQTNPITANSHYHWNMGYLMFVPQKIWKDYTKYIDDRGSRELFSRMLMDNRLSTKLPDPENPGTQSELIDKVNGSAVHEIKEDLRKYIIRIYVDNE